jgi:anti-sigma regulatory factor (Ser/Thr protein kinase)
MSADRDQHAVLCLAPEPSAPGQARDFFAARCLQWGAPQFLEPGVLVVSELVTNAVRHAGTEIRLGLELDGAVLTVAVRDGGAGKPHVVPPDQRIDGGQGMAMVAKLSEAWGVDTVDGGKSVWCRLEVDATVEAGED